MTELRLCGARGCGQPLVRFAYENAYAFKQRRTCGVGTDCPNIMRADAKYAKRVIEAQELDNGPPRVHDLLMPWHRQVQNQQ